MNSEKFTETGRFDRWFLILIFTTPLSSYFAKVSVRIDLQTFGCALPSILAPILAMLCRKVSENKKKQILKRTFGKNKLLRVSKFYPRYNSVQQSPYSRMLKRPFLSIRQFLGVQRLWNFQQISWYWSSYNLFPYFGVRKLGSRAIDILYLE